MSAESQPRVHEPELMTARELAQFVRESERTSARLNATGQIPGSIKIGAARRCNKKRSCIGWSVDRATRNEPSLH
jgi:hypothetical protein